MVRHVWGNQVCLGGDQRSNGHAILPLETVTDDDGTTRRVHLHEQPQGTVRQLPYIVLECRVRHITSPHREL